MYSWNDYSELLETSYYLVFGLTSKWDVLLVREKSYMSETYNPFSLETAKKQWPQGPSLMSFHPREKSGKLSKCQEHTAP
jgi:hypothetical protein